ncbi:probable ubiquitin-conjugating enzyme E2 24 [Triticum dicoccoides]|uniref:probable ubiquitin-conjugating enzyme E2 24 n=1 Tax=Triticum dicoccoides TaxID=85692 RepID=UPI00188DD355|nr:probable ubiquitin-conjugating enzyme E2 24 [Triticum dicoccoides]
MDVAVAVAAPTTNLYGQDLVSFQSKLGILAPSTWLSHPADELLMLGIDGLPFTKEAGDTDIALVDRSFLHVGQAVVSASDVGGQIGVVTGVTTTLDLVDRGGEATGEVIGGLPPSAVRRVRALSLGDYIVSGQGQWLDRVVEVSLDVDVVFDDGAICRVTDAESPTMQLWPAESTPGLHRQQTNVTFYPGQRVTSGDPSVVFRGARWLSGHWRTRHEVGTVTKVEMAGVLVHWIASAYGDTDEQFHHESAPPAYQNPENLTYFCCAYECSWGPSPPSLTAPVDKEERFYRKQLRKPMFVRHRGRARRGYQPPEPLRTMTVSRTRTTVDVLWQDGTRQHGVPSTSLNPFEMMNEHQVFPGQYVIDAREDDDFTAESTERLIGVVRNLNSKDHTAHAASGWWEVECDDDKAVSVYDLGRDPDHSVFYGDVVVRTLSSNVSGNNARQPQVLDLSWVGRVVDLSDGHIQVKWGNDTTSMVLPHEITVTSKEHYSELQAEMGDWLEEDSVDNHQESGAADVDNDPTDARNIQGARVEDGGSSANESDGHAAMRTNRLGGGIQSMIRSVIQVLARAKLYLVNHTSTSISDLPAATMHNVVEVSAHVAVGGSQVDPSIEGAVTEVVFSPMTRSDENGDGDVEDAVRSGEATTGDDDTLKFPNFDVVQSPPDHHYLETMDQGSSNGGKSWVKTVQKEWKILEDSLPDTIYVRAYEDRMDLLRAAMVGVSGTPYQHGLFFFDLQLPPSYPAVPPQVYYRSFGLRLNPNLYPSGTVCLSLLNTFGGEGTEVWSPGTSSLLQVVVSLQALVLNGQPYYNEAGHETLVDTPEGRRNALPYSENAFLLTLRTALHLLRQPPRGFEGFVTDHFRQRGRHVLMACEAYLRGCIHADEAGMELPCSTGFRIALANLVPRLVAAFTNMGTQG